MSLKKVPLPGFGIVVYDPQSEMVIDMIPCENGHAQERTYLGDLAERVCERDIYVADRNFCTVDYLFPFIVRRRSF